MACDNVMTVEEAFEGDEQLVANTLAAMKVSKSVTTSMIALATFFAAASLQAKKDNAKVGVFGGDSF